MNIWRRNSDIVTVSEDSSGCLTGNIRIWVGFFCCFLVNKTSHANPHLCSNWIIKYATEQNLTSAYCLPLVFQHMVYPESWQCCAQIERKIGHGAAKEVSSAQDLAESLLLCSNKPIVIQLKRVRHAAFQHIVCGWIYTTSICFEHEGKKVLAGFVGKCNMTH